LNPRNAVPTPCSIGARRRRGVPRAKAPSVLVSEIFTFLARIPARSSGARRK
jgi:hypothetical protein